MDPLVIAAVALLGVFLFVQVNTNWRLGVFFIIATGFLQDPFRKLVPGEPVALSAVVGLVMLFVWIIGLGQFRGQEKVMSIARHYPSLIRAFVLYGALVSFQALITLVNYGSLPFAGLGMIAYLGPLPAVWVGWWFCRTERDFRQLALICALCGLMVAGSVALSWLGAEWSVLKQIGPVEDILVFYGADGVITMHTGFLRAPEITAWHLGAATCAVIVLASVRPSGLLWLVGLLLLAALVAAIFLTGRRKALGLIVLFVSFFFVLLQFSRNRELGKIKRALLAAAVGAAGGFFFLPEIVGDGSTFGVYSERGASLVGDSWERFYDFGIGSAFWAWDAVGFLGQGAGVVSQGAQYFGVDFQLGGAAEGGLGKIIVELGIPGLMVIAWMLWVVGGNIRAMLVKLERVSSKAFTVAAALSAFLLANSVVFVTAAQVFGDPFVLIFLGMAFGALLAVPRLVNRQPIGDVLEKLPRGSADRLAIRPLGEFGR